MSMRTSIVLVVLSLVIGCGMVRGEDSDPLRVHVAPWAGAAPVAHALLSLLDTAGIHAHGVSTGAGDPVAALRADLADVSVSLWSDSHGPRLERAVRDDGLLALSTLGVTLRSGWLYPPGLERLCPGLPSWRALVPCAASLSSQHSFPLGEVFALRPARGALSHPFAYGLGLPYRTVYLGSARVLGHMAASRVQSDQPILVALWEGHPAIDALGLRWVTLPAYAPECRTSPSHGPDPARLFDCAPAPISILKAARRGPRLTERALALVSAFAVSNEAYLRTQASHRAGGSPTELARALLSDSADSRCSALAAAGVHPCPALDL